MPFKIPMIISNNNNFHPPVFRKKSYNANLGVTVAANPKAPPAPQAPPAPKAPSALNAGMLSRVHNVRPGCGSCGRH